MEDQEIEETPDADETPVMSPLVPSVHSEDSRNSADSYLFNIDQVIEENGLDLWGSDAYHNESTEDDAKLEAPLVSLDAIREESVESLAVVPRSFGIIDEDLEENNNDPNNNMDLRAFNVSEEAAPRDRDSAAGRSRERGFPDVFFFDRGLSPQPGCSKDSEYLPLLSPLSSPESASEISRLRKTKHILRLVSKIDHDSVFNALSENHAVSMRDIKLWDLIPQQDRCEYVELDPNQEKTDETPPENVADSAENVADFAENVADFAENVADFAENVADSAENVADFAENVADFAENVADSGENVADFAENVADSAEKVADSSENVAGSSGNPIVQMEVSSPNSGAKRGPAEDICTVRPKKSSSDSDLSVSGAAPADPLPRVSSAPKIEDSPEKASSKGAIPKVRAEPLKSRPTTPIEAWNALLTEAQRSLPIDSEFPRMRAKSKPANKSRIDEAQPATTHGEKPAASSSCVMRAPCLKYRTKKSAPIKVNATEPEKPKQCAARWASAPVHERKETKNRQESAKPTSTRVNQPRQGSGPPNLMPQRLPVSSEPIMHKQECNRRERVDVNFKVIEPAIIAGVNCECMDVSTRVAAGAANRQTRPEMANRPRQSAPTITPVSAAPIPQQREPAAINRPRLAAPTISLVPAAPMFHQRQPEVENRPTITPVSAAPIPQQREPAAMNRPRLAAPTISLVPAAPMFQQRQPEVENRPTITPVMAAPPLYYQQPVPMHQQMQPEVANWPTITPVMAEARYYQPPEPIYRQRQPETANAAASICKPRPATYIVQPRQPEVPFLNQQEAPVQPQAQPKEQNTKRIICQEMYYKLRNIFPNVDRQYIKKLCPPDWGPGNKDAQMAPIIEHLLEAGENLPQEQPIEEINEKPQSTSSYKSADELYEFFIGIFPDADPHYLRGFAVKNLGKDDAIKNFVDVNLERRDYPTREQYMARLKITEQQKQYTTGFEVKQFLSIIPEPSKHFMDAQRKCAHQTVAFEFLKSHFKKLRVTTISRAYAESQYNLSLAAHSLENLPDELKSKRGGCEMPTEDILLLQEIAFVKHKTDIDKYIAQVKKAEDDEFRMLKANNQLLECQCCYDSECVPSKCSECNNGHVFCNSCVITGTSAKMGEDQTRIYCFVNCGSEFSLSVLQQVLAPTTFSILLKKRQAAEVIEAGLEGLVSCPFCHFASIPPEGDKIFKCLNPECTKESCRLCKELSHVPLKCNEVKSENARRYIEEKMTEALARKCYRCQRAFFKEEGCNKITCPCGAQMCYLCDQPISNYRHFRGQGSDDKNLCPLFSDSIRLDAVAVRKVAEEAQREMLKRNPRINIDTSGLLPDIPRPRTGPHNDILNADELPRRAQRVLDFPPL